MATSRAQRIGIWVIAVVLTVGTIGSFVIIVLSTQNQKVDQARLTTLLAEYSEQTTAYSEKVTAQTDELSAKYYPEFSQYATRPSAFDAAGVTTLQTNDLKQGDGDTLTETSDFTAYYIGWNPSGKVFDGSIDGEKLKAPLSVAAGGVIEGWTKGVTGMKVGGVRELSIPSAQAYGETGQGEDIPANTPLKFVIFVIPTPETIPAPSPSEELLRLYGGGQ